MLKTHKLIKTMSICCLLIEWFSNYHSSGKCSCFYSVKNWSKGRHLKYFIGEWAGGMKFRQLVALSMRFLQPAARDALSSRMPGRNCFLYVPYRQLSRPKGHLFYLILTKFKISKLTNPVKGKTLKEAVCFYKTRIPQAYQITDLPIYVFCSRKWPSCHT